MQYTRVNENEDKEGRKQAREVAVEQLLRTKMTMGTEHYHASMFYSIPEGFGEGEVTIYNRHVPDGGQKLHHHNGRANKSWKSTSTVRCTYL